LDGNVFVKNLNNIFNGTLTVLDTLTNNYNVTVLVKGDVVNKGSIINNPGGYGLSLNIIGNISNEGIWSVLSTNFIGTADQTIQQIPGKSFQGAINTTDSIGDIILESDVILESNTWNMNKAILRTNGHRLLSNNYTLQNGKIISNDTLVLNNSNIDGIQLFGSYKLDGNVFVKNNNNIFNGTLTVLDTLTNNYNVTILVKGDLVNKGAIINNPGGYGLSLNIIGNVSNEGIWSVVSTNFISTADQTIQQTPGKSFQGAINTTDSIGDIILESDVILESNTWNMNKAILRTNGHRLLSNNYTLQNGKIISNDTLVLNNSNIDGIQFFGNYKLDGNVFMKNLNNIFNGTLTVLDTLANNYNVTILVNGDIVNKGSIINNPAGYGLNMQIKGNITNNHIFSIVNVYLLGTNPRTITGNSSSGIQASIYVDDSIRLVGNNILPNISFTANPKAWCVVDTSATLTLQAISNPARIINFGKISVTQSFDNAIPNTLSFYESSVNCNAGVSMNKLTIDHYGYQQHPTATGTVNCWWRFRNSPQNFNDSLVWLKLNYKTDALNGNPEDSLKVFFSPNAGLDWSKTTTGVSIDTATNTVTIANAPSYGHYLLSSTPLGITAFHPMIETIEPKFGGNTGSITLYIFGVGLKNTSTVKLKLSGQSDIVADTSYLTDAIGESMFARFDLKNKTIGVYDVVIETPGDSTLIKTTYFTITEGERSNPWVSISGRDKFLLNRWQTFTLNYGNTANTDAVGTMLVYIVKDIPGLDVSFPDINLVLPKSIINQGTPLTNIVDSIPIYYLTDTLTGYIGQSMRVYPFYIPYISAGSSHNIRVQVKVLSSGSLKMSAWVLDPFYEDIDYNSKGFDPMLPQQVQACIAYAMGKSYVQGWIGGLPVASCIPLVDQLYPPKNYISDYLLPEDAPYTWGDFLWDTGASVMNTVQCAAGFYPGIGTVTAYCISMTGNIIDAHYNSRIEEGCWRKFKNKSKSNKNSTGVNSMDPNEIVGPDGYTTDNYISSKGNISYRIYFENKDTSSASALEVFVKDTLNIAKFDLNTFSFNNITFGDTTVKIQDYAKEFSVLVDMYPDKDIIVQIHGILDTLNGAISWDFHSLDRITLELTEDPDLGFLPPNVNYPEGVANVAFSCKLKKTIAHDAIVTNKASIVFDFNAPMNTNTYSNKIDTLTPVSSMDLLNPTQSDSSFTVSWSGNDQGSGIFNYNIFVSENDSDYFLWKISSNNTSATFNGHNGSNYKFFCIATDSIGLTEEQKLTPEATTTVSVTNAIKEVNKPIPQVQFYPNPAADIVTINIINANNDAIELDIYNVMGILVRSETLKQNHQQISIKDLSDGVYTITIKSKDLTANQRLIIQR
jgi:hypothetical protein